MLIALLFVYVSARRSMYPVDYDSNKYAHVTYKLREVREETSARVVVASARFAGCAATGASELVHEGALRKWNITCGSDLVGAGLVLDVYRAERDTTVEVRGEVFEVPAGSFKVSPTVTWPNTAPDNFVVATARLKWDIPTTFSEVLDAGVNAVPRSVLSMGRCFMDEDEDCLAVHSDVVFKIHHQMPKGVQVCGDAQRPSCWVDMDTSHTFVDHKSLDGVGEVGSAPTGVDLVHKWPHVTPSMRFDPVWTVEEGQLVSGPYSTQALFYGGIVAATVLLCCCCCGCYCLCCRSKKSKVQTGGVEQGGGGGGWTTPPGTYPGYGGQPAYPQRAQGSPAWQQEQAVLAQQQQLYNQAAQRGQIPVAQYAH